MIYIVLIGLGLLLGSFVNALVWRLHEQETEAVKKSSAKKNSSRDLSIVHGRSMCSRCGHALAPKDLVPVLSWLLLRGRCRYCHKPISDTPLPELILPVLLVLSYAAWPYILDAAHAAPIVLFVVWIGILTCFVALAIYDARWYLLPDRIVLPLTVLAGVFALLVSVQHYDSLQLLWAVLGGITISGLFLALSFVSKGSWIGGGDVKIGMALGLLAGSPLMAMLVIFIASLLGTFFMLPQLLTGKKAFGSMLPFGPFLIAATGIVFLWGDSVASWYFGLLLQ